MPITDDIKMQIRLDYRSRRGVAVGFEPDIRYGKDKKSWARMRTYFLRDAGADINRTSEVRTGVPEDRYRVSLQDRTEFTENLHGIVDITKLSDEFLLQDFYPGEFQINPQPDNVIAQTESSIVYGLGMALTERIIVKDGAIEQSNFYDYLVMRMRDIPQMHIDIIATDNPPTGAGQMATPLMAPAINNAFAALTGKRLRETPMTPERVKKALA
jgi:lipopolysaccharide assembly outer membrane protein LptD (OstA)